MRQSGTQRDADAFARFYRENYALVTAYVRRRSSTDPDVIASSVFTDAWQRFEESMRLGLPWLYRAAHFELRNAERSATRRRRLESKVARSARSDGGDPMGGVVDSVWVAQVLSRLSAADRELLMLLYWEDLDHRSAGATLSCSAATVAVRAHRARRRFARLVAEDPRQQASSPRRASSPHPEARS